MSKNRFSILLKFFKKVAYIEPFNTNRDSGRDSVKNKSTFDYFSEYLEEEEIEDSNTLTSPISGGVITSKYGMRYHPIHKVMRMHRGVDLRAAEGTPILAPENGKVINIKPNNGSAGNTLYFSGSEGRVWIFMHLSSFSVKKEQVIKQGVEIAKSGKTGGVTGPHLHMELKINGSHVDPLSVISIPIRQNTPKKPNKPSPTDGSRLLT